MLITEYSNDIKKHFLGNPITHLYSQMGVINKSFELRMKGKFYADIFIINRENATHLYSLYQIYRKRNRFIF